jgi:hypothetical protein
MRGLHGIEATSIEYPEKLRVAFAIKGFSI